MLTWFKKWLVPKECFKMLIEKLCKDFFINIAQKSVLELHSYFWIGTIFFTWNAYWVGLEIFWAIGHKIGPYKFFFTSFFHLTLFWGQNDGRFLWAVSEYIESDFEDIHKPFSFKKLFYLFLKFEISKRKYYLLRLNLFSCHKKFFMHRKFLFWGALFWK